MKTISILLTAILFSLQSLAQHGDHHVKHNMVLYGEAEIFASHLVYKVPHNYQVILQVDFDPETRELYEKERTSNPQEMLIFLLDTMDIREIANVTSISGTLIRSDQNGKRTELKSQIKIPRAQFKLIYFNEIPKNL